MENFSSISHISKTPLNPMILFEEYVNDFQKDDPQHHSIIMNLASLNEKYAVLSRSVEFRGLTKNGIIFVTERNCMKYHDLKLNQKVAVTFLLPLSKNEVKASRQVRINGIAQELPDSDLPKLWEQEPLFAKIRSKICQCGKPVDWNELKISHDAILKAFTDGNEKLLQTETYTAFEIIPEMVDFYHAEPETIADRVVYTKNNGEWKHEHVYA